MFLHFTAVLLYVSVSVNISHSFLVIYFPFLITVGKNSINYIPSLKVKAGLIQSCVHSVVSPPLPKKEEEKKAEVYIPYMCIYKNKGSIKKKSCYKDCNTCTCMFGVNSKTLL